MKSLLLINHLLYSSICGKSLIVHTAAHNISAHASRCFTVHPSIITISCGLPTTIETHSSFSLR